MRNALSTICILPRALPQSLQIVALTLSYSAAGIAHSSAQPSAEPPAVRIPSLRDQVALDPENWDTRDAASPSPAPPPPGRLAQRSSRPGSAPP